MRPVDIAVAFDVALTDALRGTWAPADVRNHLGIPRATLSESLTRLKLARVVRGSFVNRPVLAAMLPILSSLAPIRRHDEAIAVGLSTGFAAPVFGGLFQGAGGLVWPVAEGPDSGFPIEPLHRRIPRHLLKTGDPHRHALLSCLDAVRGGKAREVAHGIEGLAVLCKLPPSPGMNSQPMVVERMKIGIGKLLSEGSC